MKEIRLYIEGDVGLRPGFHGLLAPVISRARERRVRVDPVFPGGIDDTLRLFSKDHERHAAACCLLLVDAEGALDGSVTRHLASRHRWSPVGVEDRHHLMVQMMESWLLADPEAMAQYYGQGFRSEVLPKEQNLEQVEKRRLEEALKRATEQTQKGSYLRHKVAHARELLRRIDSAKVRARAPHCDRLFRTLERLLD